MSAIRPSPRDTSFVTPDVATTDFADYASTLIYDSLYHSPVSGVYRMSKSYFEKHDESFPMLSPDEANKNYGMDGELKFSEPVRESFALLLRDRKIAELRREYELNAGSRDHWGRKISGFGVSMASTILDPVNLAAMFVPVVGEIRYAQGLERAAGFLNRGLISPKTVMNLVGRNRTGFRLAKGTLEGAVGAALVEPFNLIPAIDEQSHYSWKNSALNIVFSAGLGAGIRGVGGYISDNFINVSRGMQQLDPQTHEAAVMSAVSDIVQDKPVTSPAEVVSADHNVIVSQVAEANKADLVKMVDDVVDDVVVPPKEPKAPIKFSQESYTSQIAEINRVGKELKADDLLMHEWITQNPDQFEQLWKKLLKSGYDLSAARVDMGSQSLALILNDKVVKISFGERFKGIKGITPTQEFKTKVGDFYATVVDRVSPLEATTQDLSIAMDLLSKYYGISGDDLGFHNLGLTSKGKIVILDEGAVSSKIARKGTGLKEALKEATPEAIKIYEDLIARVEAEKAKVKQKTEQRVKEIVVKKQQPEVRPSIKTADEIPIKEAPEPVNKLSDEEMAEEQARLQEEIDGLEQADEILAQIDPKIEEVKTVAEKIAKWADKTVKESKKRLSTGLDPEVLAAYAVKGFTSFHEGLRDFAQWSKMMLKEFGDAIKPHLKGIFEEIQNFKMTPEMIGLEKRTGVLGKKGYYYSLDSKIEASVQIDEEGIHLTNLRAREEGKGAGGEFMTKLKQYADSNQKKITLIPEADSRELQPRLETFYKKHGFEPEGVTDYVYRPKVTKEPSPVSTETEFRLKESLTKALSEQKIKDANKISKAVEAGAACMNQKMF